MTQANEPNDFAQQQGVEARLARLEERLSRIERTTVPNDYIRRSFDWVYQDMTDLHYKIDSLAIEVDAVKQSNQRIEKKIDDVSNELNGKLDVIITLNWNELRRRDRLIEFVDGDARLPLGAAMPTHKQSHLRTRIGEYVGGDKGRIYGRSWEYDVDGRSAGAVKWN